MLAKLLTIFSFLVLIACSETENINTRSKVWSLEAPQLISKSRGTQYSMRELEIKRPLSLNTSDSLLFSRVTDNVRIQTHTVCNLNEERAQHESEFL